MVDHAVSEDIWFYILYMYSTTYMETKLKHRWEISSLWFTHVDNNNLIDDFQNKKSKNVQKNNHPRYRVAPTLCWFRKNRSLGSGLFKDCTIWSNLPPTSNVFINHSLLSGKWMTAGGGRMVGGMHGWINGSWSSTKVNWCSMNISRWSHCLILHQWLWPQLTGVLLKNV